MTFKSADITASGRTLRLVTLVLGTKKTNFDVSGTIRGTDRRYTLDLDVKSDRVDLDRLLATLDSAGQQADRKQVPEQPKSWDLPIEGRVRLAIQVAALRVPTSHAAVCDPRHRTRSDRLRGQGSQGVRHRDGGRRTSAAASMSLDVVLQARDIDPEPTLLVPHHAEDRPHRQPRCRRPPDRERTVPGAGATESRGRSNSWRATAASIRMTGLAQDLQSDQCQRAAARQEPRACRVGVRLLQVLVTGPDGRRA